MIKYYSSVAAYRCCKADGIELDWEMPIRRNICVAVIM